MKYLSLIVLFTLIACNGDDQKVVAEIESQVEPVEKVNTDIKPQNSEVKPGEYFEYHESGGLKIRGFYNDNLNREGLWLSYYESGVKWSEAYYSDGKREGHNITFFPNGKMRYMGEYKDDQKTGTWTFYDESGAVVKTENY